MISAHRFMFQTQGDVEDGDVFSGVRVLRAGERALSGEQSDGRGGLGEMGGSAGRIAARRDQAVVKLRKHGWFSV
jgi:hypothetical protein